ncbi:SMP-30/gluconolactonase/LRE family protein [Streptomyces sp. NBC_00459]|uniref:SMP-30/gluconolactonase/LRE family protein n=1 Tax=Streptomyces sp. NBC_00459 TaxID=2975749 RepID=UPI002E192477
MRTSTSSAADSSNSATAPSRRSRANWPGWKCRWVPSPPCTTSRVRGSPPRAPASPCSPRRHDHVPRRHGRRHHPRCRVDPVSGDLSGSPETFARLRDGEGSPDGMTVDDEGCLWGAMRGAGAVRRSHPDGHLLHTLTVSAPPTPRRCACTPATTACSSPRPTGRSISGARVSQRRLPVGR